MAAKDAYIVKVGAAADKRLRILRNIFHKTTMSFYRQIGLTSGSLVLEVGCGTGHVTIDIAKAIMPDGKVTGIDISEAQVRTAQKNTAASGLSNIKLLQNDITKASTKFAGQFDFVICRFLLMHVPDPIKALSNMYTYLKPGGILAVEEPEMSKCYSSIPSKAFSLAMQWHINYAKKVGLDFDIGKKLPDLFQHANIRPYYHKAVQPIVKSGMEEKNIYVLLHKESKEKYIQEKIATEVEIQATLPKLQELTDNNASQFGCALVHQVACRKPPLTSNLVNPK